MLNKDNIKSVSFDDDFQPTLCIMVDTEEEFDWSKPFSRAETSTLASKEQYRAHELYAKHNAKPTYVMDYCILDQIESATIFKDLYEQSLCEVGTHLHTWVSPPFEEEVNAINSLQANLPYDLEYEKLKQLGNAFNGVFGELPKVFKAGRYGVGPNTSEIIRRLGYKVDCSVVPFLNMNDIQGPSFLGLPSQPYWFGENQDMLEVPLTKGFAGNFSMLAPPIAGLLISELGEKLKLRGIASKLKLFDLINLTPEGYETDDLERILRAQMKSGQKVLSLTYHSSSLKIDGSPYVKSELERKEFLSKIDRILSIFIHDYGGRVIPAIDLYDELKRE